MAGPRTLRRWVSEAGLPPLRRGGVTRLRPVRPSLRLCSGRLRRPAVGRQRHRDRRALADHRAGGRAVAPPRGRWPPGSVLRRGRASCAAGSHGVNRPRAARDLESPPPRARAPRWCTPGWARPRRVRAARTHSATHPPASRRWRPCAEAQRTAVPARRPPGPPGRPSPPRAASRPAFAAARLAPTMTRGSACAMGRSSLSEPGTPGGCGGRRGPVRAGQT
jgi:hypothetical protein